VSLPVFAAFLILWMVFQFWPSSAFAQAGDSPNPNCANVVNTGGGSCVSGPVQLTAQEQAILAKKTALVQEYLQVRAGKFSYTTFQSDMLAFFQTYGGSKQPQSRVNPACPTISTQAPAVTCGTNAVYAPQFSQINYSYCGPATAYEILYGLGWTSGPNGESLSQSVLAKNSYLKTDANGGTNWSPYVMGPTLNSWTRSGWYIAVNGSGVGSGFTSATFISDLTFDIDDGWPLAGNIVEYAGSNNPHLVGHPSSLTIYHWIAIKGYTSYGNNTTYDDSVSGDSWIWSWAANVPAVSTIASTTMTTLLNGRGFVW